MDYFNEDTEQGNILIAKYLGFDMTRYENDGVVEGYNLDNDIFKSTFCSSELKFNKSWDWLMEVIDKIEVEHSFKNTIVGSYNNMSKKWINVYKDEFYSRIEATYYMVIEYIEWVNNKY